MTFISYAQNYEDVMLWRALKHIENGFYIDVGAFDPIFHSITNAFYERGWSGINIEPSNAYYSSLCKARARDVNLNVAAGEASGEYTFYEIPSTGLSTMDAKTAEIQSNSGWEVNQRVVEVVTLNSIFEKYVHVPVHFLKIDVEGFEESVIKGLDLNQWRPWILLIEATIPSTNEAKSGNWDASIISANYQEYYFDGINRFYIAAEHSSIIESTAPVNLFDGFIQIDHKKVIDEKEFLKNNINGLEEQLGIIKQKELDFEGLREDNSQLRSDNQKLRLDNQQLRESIQQLSKVNELNSLYQQEIEKKSKEIEQIINKVHIIETERDNSLRKVNELSQEKEKICLQLDEVWMHRDTIIEELNRVYRSRSFRIMAPLRLLMGMLRKIKGKIKGPLIRVVQLLKNSYKQLVSNCAELFRKGFPKIYYKAAHNMKLRRIYLRITSPKETTGVWGKDPDELESPTISQIDLDSNNSSQNNENKGKTNWNRKEKMKEEINNWQVGERNYD